ETQVRDADADERKRRVEDRNRERGPEAVGVEDGREQQHGRVQCLEPDDQQEREVVRSSPRGARLDRRRPPARPTWVGGPSWRALSRWQRLDSVIRTEDSRRGRIDAMNGRRGLMAVVAALALALGAAVLPAQEREPVRIGLIYTNSGPLAQLGIDMRDANV